MTVKSRHELYKWSTTVGCFLLFLPFGQTFFWGNMYTYCISYLSHYTGMDPTDQAPWLLTLKLSTTGLTGLISGFLVYHTGNRPLLVCGIVLTSASYFLTYVAVQNSNSILVLSFGVLYGLADGFIFTVAPQMMVDWAGDKDGTFIAIARSGMNVGAIFTNAFITWYVNPENKTPDQKAGPVVYFSQEDILDRVPNSFVILGSICTVVQIIGFVLVRDKPSDELEEMAADERDYGTHDRTEFDKSNSLDNNVHALLQNQQVDKNTSNISRSLMKPFLSTPSPSPSALTHKQSPTYATKNLSNQSNNVSPRQMISMPMFYTVLITFLTTNVVYVTVNNYYKEFGQLFISDDFFLTRMGTAMPVVSIFFSVIWGVLMDRLSMKYFFILFTSCLTLLGCVYTFTPRLNIWLFSIFSVVYAGVVNPFYSIYNGAVSKLFGKKHFAANQGILGVSSIAFDPAISPALAAILLHFGWDYLFLLSAFISLLGLLAVIVTRL